MASSIAVKLVYNSAVAELTLERTTKYIQVVQKAIERFGIAEHLHSYLLVCDHKMERLDVTMVELLLSLTPITELTLHIFAKDAPTTDGLASSYTESLLSLKFNDFEMGDDSEEEIVPIKRRRCNSAPVRRQNAILGLLPIAGKFAAIAEEDLSQSSSGKRVTFSKTVTQRSIGF